MKVIYVITRSDVMGGASVHLLDLAVGAQRAGYDVEVLVGGTGVFLDKAKNLDVRCTSLKYLRREISPWHDLLGFIELRQIFKKTKPDLVHLHSSKAGMLGRLAAKSVGLPAVFTAHGWAFTEGVSSKKKFLYIPIERLMAIFSDAIIAVSEYDRQLALHSNVGNEALINTVHNGMPDMPKLQRSRSQDSIVKLIMVARFDAQKDHSLLINAVSQLEDQNWHLELVGDGPLLEQAATHVKALGLTERISFSGACSDVAKRLEQSDVFLLVSNWEGLPLTILEAMRAGLPVIASSVGGVPEAVEHDRTGFLVPRSDMQALTKAIQNLIVDEDTRLSFGQAGRAKFEEEFLFDSMLTKTLNIYQEVINNKL